MHVNKSHIQIRILGINQIHKMKERTKEVKPDPRIQEKHNSYPNIKYQHHTWSFESP